MENHPIDKRQLAIGFLMTTSPEHQNRHTVFRLIEELLAAGHRVSLFLMDDGIYHIVRIDLPNSPSAHLEKLMKEGLAVSLCTQSAEWRGIFEADAVSGIGWLSQHELSRIVASSDRFMAFGA
ncbi:MAG: DsrE family protein [Candidatus Manganitrophus sp.]|nr:DsrE family protein [Candidatus Manganitrophus sp.]WDT71308.1 MAG: DsrE family protein [Candidatus Manganitrophus sp.]